MKEKKEKGKKPDLVWLPPAEIVAATAKQSNADIPQIEEISSAFAVVLECCDAKGESCSWK